MHIVGTDSDAHLVISRSVKSANEWQRRLFLLFLSVSRSTFEAG